MDHLLSWIIWLPVIGMAIIVFIPRDKSTLIKQTAALVSGIQLLLAIYLWSVFDASNGNLQFMERAEWIPSFNIHLYLGCRWIKSSHGISYGAHRIHWNICELEYF